MCPLTRSFFCGGVVPYLVLGMVFMRVRRQASGADMIPNREFWGALPGLVKDGFVFTWQALRGNRSGYSNLSVTRPLCWHFYLSSCLSVKPSIPAEPS